MIFLKTPLILFNSYDRRYVISPISSFLAYSHVTASGNSPPSYFLSSSFFFNSTLFSSSLGILNTKSKENKSLYSSLRPCSKTKSDTFFLLDSRNLSVSMSTSSCSGSPEFEACRDDDTALILKIVAIAAIFLAGALGVAGPLIGKKYRLLKTDSSLFFTIKAFAAGVILATGFVHMLPDATSALSNPCLPKIPWSTFPVAGFIAMMAALTTLLADFITTQYYEGKHKKQIETDKIVPDDLAFASVVVPLVVKDGGADEDGCGIHIMGVDGQNGQIHEHFESHSHSHGFSDDSDNVARHIVVSQVLEFGIVSHSIIIGLSLGVSQSPCTIRPLLGALSFHQFFEGFALAGCISQARFGNLRSIVMACFFAITTPVSIGIGIGIASFYNPNSPRALVVEGILDSVSAGILVYMALVDLIAAEFLSKRMGSKLGHQMVSFIALYLGAGLMASLATWT